MSEVIAKLLGGLIAVAILGWLIVQFPPPPKPVCGDGFVTIRESRGGDWVCVVGHKPEARP